ncbi:Fatty acyl-CoA reductase [Temnothorax longispinosus]|uniref:Fatty acyl-CoA reductase n=1 Tax=Temnothorax longispinosus TaxID=300112 RepID=A0A4S2KWI3_9HYME|nr:Fatty acyl-CoA reductase [Temnothorax longispinosus]
MYVYVILLFCLIGGTGFVGKILTEKLLRSCPDILTIYLLIRSKKDKSPESRLDEMFEKRLFDRVEKEVLNFGKKIVPIISDLDTEDFGLSENDKNILINQQIRFIENIKNSTIINVITFLTLLHYNATATILKLAKHMLNLKSFIHVSTAYANYHVKHIEERFYSYPINHKDLFTFTRNLHENIIEEKISR